MATQPMIVVRGEGFREVPPELAVLSVVVNARGSERDAVMSSLIERSGRVRELVDAAGDAVERREAGTVQVFPEYRRRAGERLVTYAGSVGTTVTVTDFAALGDLVSRLAGVEQISISGPWWQLRPGSRAGADVRREAITDALNRAREYADAVGARVDRLVEIADEGFGGGFRNLSMAASPSEDDAVLQFDPQPQTVQAAVTVRVTITEPALD